MTRPVHYFFAALMFLFAGAVFYCLRYGLSVSATMDQLVYVLVFSMPLFLPVAVIALWRGRNKG